MGSEDRPKHSLLLVEDNPGDVRLVREALKLMHMNCDLHVVGDGEQALTLLRKCEPYVSATTPDLILLDLNLPKMNGRELLGALKMDDELKHIPVVVLTTSDSARDVLECYRLYANCYVCKPIEFREFAELLKTLGQFWFEAVLLPAA